MHHSCDYPQIHEASYGSELAVLQVDLFINYDCDLQAANLYERTSKVLSELAVLGDPTAPAGQGTRVRDAAVACCISMMSSLDAWTGK